MIIKIFLFSFVICHWSFIICFSQPRQVQNAYMYLREKKYDKAKASADSSVVHEKTKYQAKAWLYRGQIYQAIFQDTSEKVNQLDEHASEKAVESFVQCAQLDKEKYYTDQIKEGLASSAGNLLWKTENYYMPAKKYDMAIAACTLLTSTLPYDSDEGLKRRNITAENLDYIQYRAYYLSDDITKAKELGNKLVSMNYKIPDIYSSMAKIFLAEKDTVSAISYLDKGLALFEDNMDLLTLQIDILLLQKKNDALLNKLQSAVEISPDNDLLHTALGNIYVKLKENEKAKKEFIVALELNPKNEYALFNLGNLYTTEGSEWSAKLNDLPLKEKAKEKEYEERMNESYRKAISFFEQYYQINPDKAVKQRLRKLYYRLGETEKAEKYK